MKIQRNTTPFYFFIAISVLILIGGTVLLTSDLLNSLYIILFEVGLLLLLYGITEPDQKLSKILIVGSYLLYGIAALVVSYTFFQSGRFITASVFAITGFVIFAVSAILWVKKENDYGKKN